MNNPTYVNPATCKHDWAVYSDLSIKCRYCGKAAFKMDTADWHIIHDYTKAQAAYQKAEDTAAADPNHAGLYPAVRKYPAPPPIISWSGQGRTSGPGFEALFWAGLAVMCLAGMGGVYLILKGLFG